MSISAQVRRSPRIAQALVMAGWSVVGVLALITLMDVWPAFFQVLHIILAIAIIGGVVGAVLPALAAVWRRVVGSLLGFACAVAYASYVVSQI
jgi:hypothetical protein